MTTVNIPLPETKNRKVPPQKQSITPIFRISGGVLPDEPSEEGMRLSLIGIEKINNKVQ